MFDRICAENGIRHLLTAPRSPTTTGKVERLHKTMRAEFFNDADGRYATIEQLQEGLDAWVVQYNTQRPHQSLGMRPPVDRFALAAAVPGEVEVLEPVPVVAPGISQQPPGRAGMRLAGVQRWVDQHGVIRLAGFSYRVPIVLAGEPVEAVVADNLVAIYHREVLVASHVQRRKPDKEPGPPVQGRRTSRKATTGPMVTRVADNHGSVSFAGTMYRAGNAWRGKRLQVSIVASSVQLAYQGTIVRVHPIRHDRAKEHGAFATPRGRPRKQRHDAPGGDGVKAKPLRGRLEGRALTPSP